MCVNKNFFRLLFIVGLASTTIVLFSCESNPTEPPPTLPPKIETDNEVTVATQSVGSGGGTVRVISADPYVNGMEIQVPANSYPDARIFTVSFATIKSHEFGEFFRPITPLITISNGGGYADSMLTLKIPVAIADSVYPLAFFYDDENEILEGLPVIAYDKQSVTIGTHHFDVSGIASGSRNYSKRQPSGTISYYSRLVLTMATPAMVKSIAALKPLLATKYYPGADDWEFTNFGSYMPKARGGHCAGQNSSSLWYYYEKKVKGRMPMLHGLYDSLDNNWVDNQLGYRFASAVQNDMVWESTMQNIYENWVSMQDDYTWTAFVVSMYLIGEPFDVGIYGHDALGNSAGHDLTAYSIDVPGRTIYVADPNYPGDRTRKITYNGATFDPYYAGRNADESGLKFTSFKFSSKTTFINWDKIGEEFTRCVTNKQNPGFPDYNLWLNVMPTVKLLDAYHIAVDTADISITWSEPSGIFYQVFNRAGERVLPAPAAGYSLTDRGVLRLNPGENLFGFTIFGVVPGVTPKKYKWVDFRWIRLYYDTTMARIEPETMSGVKLQQYVWSAIVSNRPKDVRYEWDWGDGTSKFTANNDSVAYHSYTNDGNYTIKLDVFDRPTNTKVVDATATATISSGIELTNVWPSSQSFAMPVHITGKNFGTSQGNGTVSFGPYPAYSIVSWTPTEIVATVPEMFTGGDVVVTIGGVSSAGLRLNFKEPAISSLIPDSGYAGDVIKIRGEGFGALRASRSAVEFQSTDAEIVSWSDTMVQVIVPEATIGSNMLFLTVSNGHLDRYDYFKVLENHLNTLHGMNCLGLAWFNTRYKRFVATPSPHEEYTSGGVSISAPLCSLSYMKWSGTSFSQKVTDNTVPGTTEITTVNGSVSADGRKIVTITVKYEWTRAEYSQVQELTFTDIPVTQSSPHSSIHYSITGQGVQSHVAKVSDEMTKNGVLYKKYLETDWADTTVLKGIYINFDND